MDKSLLDKAVLDLSEFTDEEQQAFLLRADGVRRRHQGDTAYPGFAELWEKISAHRTPMDDEAVDAIVAEAIVFARGQT